MEAAERLLPILVEAGYAAIDDAVHTWWFTDTGILRAEELNADGPRPA